MKKRIFALLILLFKFISYIVPFMCNNEISNTKELNTKDTEKIEEVNVSIEHNTEIFVSQQNQQNLSVKENTLTLEELEKKMNNEIEKIPYDFYDMNQKKQWFISYKEIVCKYPELCKPTIYDAFNEEELELLFKIVQAEVGDEYDFDEKANVCSVIFNRLEDDMYSSLTEVLTAEEQFSSYWDGRYLEVEIDNKTILACEYVYIFGDTTDGCYGFQMKKVEGWNGWEWIFKDDCHHFYKRKEG